MAEVTLAFEIVADEQVTLDVEDYEVYLNKPWDEMSEDEKHEFAMDYMYKDAFRQAEQCSYGIGCLDYIEVE